MKADRQDAARGSARSARMLPDTSRLAEPRRGTGMAPPDRAGRRAGDTTDLAKSGRSYQAYAPVAGGDAPGAAPAARPRVERSPLDSTQRRPARDGAIDSADERLALEALPPDRRDAYERLARRVEGNPRAREALYNLLSVCSVNDRTLRGGEDLLAVLDRISQQPVATGIDRDALLQQTIIEIDDASTIGQKTKNSCGATAAQVTLANRHPAEYARVVSGLASPEGRVQIANGDTIFREADWDAADGGRSIPSRLLQPAFMEYANGSTTDYANGSDTNRQQDGSTYSGLYTAEEQHLYQGLLNRSAGVENTTRNGGSALPADTLQHIADAVSGGKPAAALIDYPGTGGHYVTVTAVRADRVYYQNPWGTVESMPRSEFQARLMGAVYPGTGSPAAAQSSPAPPASAPPAPTPVTGQPTPTEPAPQTSWLGRLWDWIAS